MGALYDLICLDIMMPGMNGQEALKLIREEESKAKIKGSKVLMTTALDDSKNVMSAFKEQCDGYLVKPITTDKLKEKLLEFKLV